MNTGFRIPRAAACALIGAALGALPGAASVEFDGAARALHVSGFLPDSPLRLKNLARLDRMHGWACVVHDPASDTYTLEADLVIGGPDGADTYVQIGAADSPRETLVLNGSLFLHTTGKNKGIHRLTLGDRGRPDIQPGLRFGGGGAIYLGCTATNTGAGGELRLYHATVGGLDPARPAGRNHLRGWRCTLEAFRTAFVCFREPVVFESHAWMTRSIEECLFADSTAAFVNSSGTFVLTGCTFRGLTQAAFLDFTGPVRAELADCVFEQNARNWDLSRGGSITCTDCLIGAPSEPDRYGIGADAKTKAPLPARFLDRRHLRVKVTDARGRPVDGAAVRVTPETGGADGVFVGSARTGPDGLTPGPGSDAALLLAVCAVEADAAGAPRVTRYSYALEATYQGQAGRMTAFQPGDRWAVVPLSLRD